MLEGYLCAAISFRRAPVDVLAKLQKRSPGEAALSYATLSASREAVVLQTCNRFEVYAYSENPASSAAKLSDKLREEADVEPDLFFGEEAVRHLFRVAASLDSMVVGEYEILGQVGEALEEAVKSGAAGPMMKALFEKAVRVGRRVRAETGISRGPVSIARLAVESALEEAGRNARILVVGAGRVGSMLARYLKEFGARRVVIANRTVEKARALAEQLGYGYASLEELPGLVASADLVFVATSAPSYVVTRDMLTKSNAVLYDLSTHGNVEPVDGLAAIRTIDDLRARAEENRRKRIEEARRAEGIIEEELALFSRLVRRKEASSLLKPLLDRAESIRRSELERALRMLGCEEAGEEVLEAMTRSIVNKILGPLIETVRSAADRGDENLLKALRESIRRVEVSGAGGKK